MPRIECLSAVLYAFKVEQGRAWYLLLRRGPAMPDPGTWETLEALPTQGENSARAAVRVLLEETSLTPIALWALERAEVEFDPHADEIRLKPVYVALVSGEVRSSAAYDTCRWLSDREAVNSLRSEPQRTSLDVVHREVGLVVSRGQEPNPRLRVV
ncbi:MAG: hypothetical protein HMLKMBBP_03584 [Planctomycetes bacterium]|nr:hypothetical protein [Planctomycetota bacterium]